MYFSLTPRQLLFLFYIITLLFSCVLGVRSSDNKPRTCCASTSNVRVKGDIVQCTYTQKVGNCREAFVFSFRDGNIHCSSVNAKGIKATLAKLKKNEITCLGMTKS